MIDLNSIKNTADFIVTSHNELGDYIVSEHWGPEGDIYRGLCCWALVASYYSFRNEEYLKTCEKILRRYRDKQIVEGGWALCLGENGIGFKISDEERKETERNLDPIITGTVLKALTLYREASGANDFIDLEKNCLKFISCMWDERENNIMGNNLSVNKLRMNPASYNFMVLEGVASVESKNSQLFQDIYESVRNVFLDYDEEAMPLMFGYHAYVLAKHKNSNDDFDEIEQKIYWYLDRTPFFDLEYQGGLGHHDGLRGVCFDELHLRSTAGVLMSFNAIELADRKVYEKFHGVRASCYKWLEFLKDLNGYYEFFDKKDKKRKGKGSVGQYLPIFVGLGLEK